MIYEVTVSNDTGRTTKVELDLSVPDPAVGRPHCVLEERESFTFFFAGNHAEPVAVYPTHRIVAISRKA